VILVAWVALDLDLHNVRHAFQETMFQVMDNA